MFQRCLICTDFTDGLHRLVHFVPSLAAGGIKQIVFVHIVPLNEEGGRPRVDTEKIQKASDRLSLALAEIPPGVEVKVEVISGKPLEAIPKIATTYQADLIITGMPIRSLLQEKLFGSTTSGLAKNLKTPLMILRPQLISIYTKEELDLRCRHLFRHLLIPYNGSKASHYVITQIKKFAQKRLEHSFEKCFLTWVIDDGNLRQIPKDYQVKEATEKLESTKQDLAQLNLQVETEVRLGNPFNEILDIAANSNISAIAISASHLGGLLEWSVPSFSDEIIRRSWFPVLFFPGQS